MPDAAGKIRGTGWSRAAEATFDRLAAAGLVRSGVPSDSPTEVDEWLADRTAAEDDGWQADRQAARDGYSPAR